MNLELPLHPQIICAAFSLLFNCPMYTNFSHATFFQPVWMLDFVRIYFWGVEILVVEILPIFHIMKSEVKKMSIFLLNNTRKRAWGLKVNEIPIKTQKGWGLEGLLVNVWRFGKSGTLERAWKLCALSHTRRPACLFHLAVSEFYLFK